MPSRRVFQIDLHVSRGLERNTRRAVPNHCDVMTARRAREHQITWVVLLRPNILGGTFEGEVEWPPLTTALNTHRRGVYLRGAAAVRVGVRAGGLGPFGGSIDPTTSVDSVGARTPDRSRRGTGPTSAATSAQQMNRRTKRL